MKHGWRQIKIIFASGRTASSGNADKYCQLCIRDRNCIKTTDEYRNKAVASLIDRYNPYLMIVFCFSKERTKELGEWLGTQGYNVDVLHGEMSQAKRKTVMKAFREAKLQVLVASDLAARGLDIEGVTHVVNYDIPHDVDWYVHRIGRTGRAGNEGIAVTLYTDVYKRQGHLYLGWRYL